MDKRARAGRGKRRAAVQPVQPSDREVLRVIHGSILMMEKSGRCLTTKVPRHFREVARRAARTRRLAPPAPVSPPDIGPPQGN